MLHGGCIVVATLLYCAEGLTGHKTQLNDSERLEVLVAINKVRSDVQPTASDMLVIVSQHQSQHHAV